MTRTRAWLCCALVCVVAGITLATPTSAAEPFEGDLQATPDTSGSSGLWHLYNDFDIGAYYPSFDAVFGVYVTDGVDTEWDSTGVAQFIEAVMDDDSTNAADAFPMIWDYFCFNDSDTTYAGVSFTLKGRTTPVYTRIYLYLYDKDDFDCPPQSTSWYCKDYAWQQATSLILPINAREPAEVANFGFSHELQHLCYEANNLQFPYWDYVNINESLSTCAEHMREVWDWVTNDEYDVPYDACIYRGEECDVSDKYAVEQVWMAYLFDHTKGNVADPTDDVVYNWVRYETGGESEVHLGTLADLLSDSDYSWIEGSTGSERLKNFFQYFAVAKFADAPEYGSNNRFGYVSDYNPLLHEGFFLDNCTWYCNWPPAPQRPVDCPDDVTCTNKGCWNVRILPPEYTLGSAEENTLKTVSGYYQAADSSQDYIDVATYGTDYIIFRAGNYFQDDQEHELHFSFAGDSISPPANNEVKAWVIGYSSEEDTLQLHPEDIVFVERLGVDDDSTNGSMVITDFGRSIKSAVVVITLVETVADTSKIDYFEYEYSYGVYTQNSSTVTWAGDVFMTGDATVPDGATLEIDRGTKVRIWTSDLASVGADTTAIEWSIYGTLEVSGTASAPVEVFAWDASGESSDDDAWRGIAFHDSTGAAGALDHFLIEDASEGIATDACLALDNSTIENCGVGLSVEGADTVTVLNSTIRGSSTACVSIDQGARVWIRGSTIKGSANYGVEVRSGSQLWADDTVFRENDVGVYVSDGDSTWAGAEIDSCTVNANDIGIKVYRADSVTVSHCAVDSNDTDGIYCLSGAGVWIHDNTIRYNTRGVFCDDSGPWVADNTITYNTGGISCDGQAHAVVEGNVITNGHTGVTAVNDAEPDLGHISGGSSDGDNSIHTNTSHFVANLTQSVTIMAENNYWGVATGSCEPKATKFFGSVDRTPAQCSPPTSSGAEVNSTANALPKVYGLGQNYPNPFNPTTTLRFQVPPPGGAVSLVIYNVRGQVVRTLVNSDRPPGYYSQVWDGTNNQGRSVSSGIYFARMVAQNFEKTRKMVLLK